MTARRAAFVLRLVAPLAGLTLLAVFAALYLGDRDLYFRAMGLWGVPAYRYPFLDWEGVSAFVECWRRGINVYVSDPCDVRGQLFNYSPLWLEAKFVPFGPLWRNVIGVGMDVTFFASLYSVFRPKTRGEAALFTLASVSSMVAFAAERANVDLALFVMIVGAGLLASGGLGRRLLAYGLIFFAGLLKFYPGIALVTALRERLAILAGVAAVAVAATTLFAYGYRHELAAVARSITVGLWGGGVFGAVNLVQAFSAQVPSRAVTLAAVGLAAICAGAVTVSFLRDRGWVEAAAAMDRREQTMFVLGAAIMVGCFFAGRNGNYRGIFLLPVVAGLIAMRRACADTSTRSRLGWLVAIVIALMWDSAVMRPVYDMSLKLFFLVWCVFEVLFWYAIASLLAVLIVFAAQSQVFADLHGLVVRPRRP